MNIASTTEYTTVEKNSAKQSMSSEQEGKKEINEGAISAQTHEEHALNNV